MIDNVMPDPLIELGYTMLDDTELWSKLLTMAHERDSLLAKNLATFRVRGMKLLKMSNGNYIMRPILQGDDVNYTSDDPWEDDGEYKRASNRYLIPYRGLIVELLEKLGRFVDSIEEV